jgi:hypothetical protein
LYPDDALEGLAVDQVVGGVEDMIVDTVPFLFAPEADKVRGNLCTSLGLPHVTDVEGSSGKHAMPERRSIEA